MLISGTRDSRFYLEGGFYVDSKAVFFLCIKEQTMCVYGGGGVSAEGL